VISQALCSQKRKVLLHDATLYINELKRYLKTLTPNMDDPLNRLALTEEEITAGFNMLFTSQLRLFSRMARRAYFGL
jgi:hypothetical protein